MNYFLRTIAATFLIILFSGCGQSGPLYVPGDPSEMKAPPSAQQPADEEKEEKEEKADDESAVQ